MTVSDKRLAILFHEGETPDSVKSYVISDMAQYWREDGHEVLQLFGTSRFIPADLVVVHVDLSVVPESYLAFARRYPIVLNGHARDIRKSSFSESILHRDAVYAGKVIVKSDLNYAGEPERRFAAAPSLLQSLSSRVRNRYRRSRALRFEHSRDYRVYDHLREVPRHCFNATDIIVEKFRPEMDGEMFCVRNYHFLGDRAFTIRLKAASPIVNGGTFASLERIEPDQEMVAARAKLRYDYGKFDYVVVDGEAILLDVNKTIGMTLVGHGIHSHPEILALRRFRAEGVYSYFR
jgi:hypothetical protein